MANKGTPTIIEGKKHFQSFIYEGNGGGQRVGRFVPFTDSGTIAKSCIFDAGSNVGLTRTPGGAGNRKTFTVSVWAKRGVLGDQSGSNTYGQRIFNAGSSGNFFDIKWSGSGDTEGANRLHIREYSSSAEQIEYWTNRTFEDTSKWYHILLAVDTTQASSGDRIKLYVDGDQITSWYRSNAPSQDFDTQVNSTASQNIGRFLAATTNNLSGYLAEFNLVDGTALTPSTFGLTDTSTGRWIPKTLTGITYGTNGFRLTFGDSVAIQNIGYDTSGNGNNLTVTNIATTDVTTDSPTQNHMTFDPLRSSDWTFTEGNLTCAGTPSSGAGRHSLSNMILPKSGKYYFEMTVDVNNDSPRYFGLAKADASVTEGTASNVDPRIVIIRNGGTNDGHFYYDSTISSANGFSTTNGTVINFALDATNEKLYVGKDGNYYDFEGGSGNPTNGTGATFSNIYKSIDWRAINMSFSTGSGGTSHKVTWNFGGKTFAHTAPTGFSALQQDNFPLASSPNNELVDIAWIKNQDAGDYQQIYDSSRGPLKKIGMYSSDIAQQATTDDGLQKFLIKGFEVEDNDAINSVGESYVAWTWHVNGGTTSANSDGSGASIASTIQANQDAGISIVTYDGSGSSGTIAHGLSQAPDVMFIKNITSTGSTGANIDWVCYHHKLPTPETGYIVPSRNYAKNQFGTEDYFGNTNPTNKVFYVAADVHTNAGGGAQYLAYCWHEVDGYSMMGEYEGNGNVNGPFIYTGFLPQYLWIKNIDNSTDWYVYNFASDFSAKNEYDKHFFWSNSTQTQQTGSEEVDLLSNGFKLRGNNSGTNQDGYTFVYMAFAEFPFVGNAVSPLPAQ